jgi:uncharacterized Tic20 family protein
LVFYFYLLCLDLINFKISSALLALSVLLVAAGASVAVSVAGAVSFTSAFTGAAVFCTGAG